MKFPVLRRRKNPANGIRGLGDVVALVAEPVKRTIKKFKPDFDCGGCEERKAKLNRRFPL